MRQDPRVGDHRHAAGGRSGMVKVVRRADAEKLAMARQVATKDELIRSMTFPVEGSDLLRLRLALLHVGRHLTLTDRVDAARNLEDVQDSPLTAEIRATAVRLDALIDSILKLPVGRPVPTPKDPVPAQAEGSSEKPPEKEKTRE